MVQTVKIAAAGMVGIAIGAVLALSMNGDAHTGRYGATADRAPIAIDAPTVDCDNPVAMSHKPASWGCD